MPFCFRSKPNIIIEIIIFIYSITQNRGNYISYFENPIWQYLHGHINKISRNISTDNSYHLSIKRTPENKVNNRGLSRTLPEIKKIPTSSPFFRGNKANKTTE